MKRISLILGAVAVLAIIITFLGAKTAEAGVYDAGCYGTNAYSVTTGMSCQYSLYSYNFNQTNTYIPGCDGYNLYSVVTGQPCNGSGYQNQYPTNTDSYLFVRELTVGSKGEDVTALQQILLSRGYSVGSIDGAYGGRTRVAVMNYQQSRGLPATGRADWTTLSSLTSSTLNPTYPIDPVCTYQYPSTCYPSYGAPSISQVSGPQNLSLNQDGAWTIIASNQWGGNMTYSVDWGDNYNLYPYYNGLTIAPVSQQSATFTHRYSVAGTYNPVFTVTNSSGQTAKTSLRVVVNSSNSNLTPTISYLAPNYGRTGTSVTVYGRNFAYSGNVVNFGGTQISNVYSWNGTSLTFTVPSVPQIYCVQAPCVQNFNVTVIGTNGIASNSVVYTVTY